VSNNDWEISSNILTLVAAADSIFHRSDYHRSYPSFPICRSLSASLRLSSDESKVLVQRLSPAPDLVEDHLGVGGPDEGFGRSGG
jgi:hypothetical protein